MTDNGMFDAGFRLEPVSMSIGLRRNASTKPRAPQYKGYLCINIANAERLLAQCKASDDGSIFLDVALWDEPAGNESKVDCKGKVSTQRGDSDKMMAPEPQEKKQSSIFW